MCSNKMISEEMYASFRMWYPEFEPLTFKSIIVDIPDEVLAYLQEDGIYLPVEAVSKSQHDGQKSNENDSDDSDDCKNEKYCNETKEVFTIKRRSFPEFSQKLQDAINSLGGSVFIKACWSAPTDASWIIPNKILRCSTIQDIYLLLNGSSKLIANFNSLKSEDKCYIVIKKWEDIDPSTEFRCFVCNNCLMGISQRDCSVMYSYIADEESKIIRDITRFFLKYLRKKCALNNYTFDVIRLMNGHIILVDIGVLNKKYCKPYLFTWDELTAMINSDQEREEPEFRYVGSSTGIQPSDEFTGFSLPYDLANTASSKQVIDSLIQMIESEMKLEEE